MRKITLLICLLLFTATSTYAQIIFQNTIGGTQQDEAITIIETSDGGFLLVGLSNSGISGDKTVASNGGEDFWIVKTNNLGVVQWDNSIGGSGDDFVEAAIETSDGGFLLVGSSSSPISGDKTEAPIGAEDFWIVKTNNLGVVQWDNTIGGTDDDVAVSVIELASGNFIIAGASLSGISGDKTEASVGGEDIWLVEVNNLGVVQSDNTIGGTGTDEIEDISNTSDGGFIINTSSDSGISGDKTEASNGDFDFWIVKFNTISTIDWQSTIGGDSGDFAIELIETNDNGFLIAGDSDSSISGDKTEASIGDLDFWIVKLNSSGVFQWDNTIGGDNEDGPTSIFQKANDNFILAGFSRSAALTGDKTEAPINLSTDIWIVETSSTGVVIGNKIYGTDLDEEPSEIIQTNDENFVIVSNVSSLTGDNTEASNGLDDYWLLKIDQASTTLSINENTFSRAIKAFPNPTLEEITVAFEKLQDEMDIIVFNNIGQVLDSYNYKNQSSIKVKINYPNGVYFIKMINKNGEQSTIRVIKN